VGVAQRTHIYPRLSQVLWYCASHASQAAVKALSLRVRSKTISPAREIGYIVIQTPWLGRNIPVRRVITAFAQKALIFAAASGFLSTDDAPRRFAQTKKFGDGLSPEEMRGRCASDTVL
jgi:hypothetical protein